MDYGVLWDLPLVLCLVLCSFLDFIHGLCVCCERPYPFSAHVVSWVHVLLPVTWQCSACQPLCVPVSSFPYECPGLLLFRDFVHVWAQLGVPAGACVCLLVLQHGIRVFLLPC